MQTYAFDKYYRSPAISHYYLVSFFMIDKINRVSTDNYALRRGYRILTATTPDINYYFETYVIS